MQFSKIVVILLIIFFIGISVIPLSLLIYKEVIQIDDYLEILALIMSWPIITLIITILIFTRFHGSIDFFLRNIREVSITRGNMQVQSKSIKTTDDVSNGKSTPINKEQKEQIDNLIKDMQKDITTANKERDEIEKLFLQAYEDSVYWEFNYLNIFFVDITKQVLLWFSHSSPQTKKIFDQLWQTLINDESQRNVILEVLVQYNMLQSDSINYSITKRGYTFLQFIGRIPYSPE